MKFDLFFPKTPKGISDMTAETVWDGSPAYIYVAEAYDAPNMGKSGMVDSGGRVLLMHEAMSEEECCNQIDYLIEDLKKIKSEGAPRV